MSWKERRDQALNIADFKIDDILSIPGERLLAEVAEDHGHPAHLAAAFDAIAAPFVSGHDARGVSAAGNGATRDAAPAAPPPLTARPPSPAVWSFPRAALATAAAALVAPLRRRAALGACAALLLVAVLALGLYPGLIDPSVDRIVTAAKQEPAAAGEERRVSTLSPSPPAGSPAPAGAPEPSSAFSPTPVSPTPPPAPRAPQPFEAARASPPAAAGGEAPRSAATAEARVAAAAASPPAQAPLRRESAAKARLGEGAGFVVELAAAKSEAEARGTFQRLRSKYAVLQGRQPVIRRKDDGQARGPYAVQVGPFASHEEAEALCARLKAAGGSCVTTRDTDDAGGR